MLITAPPGSGKSVLVNNLSKSYGFKTLTFNMTQVANREGITDIFEEIGSAQAHELTEDWLIFIDEINAKVQGEFTYGSFLTPIEDGFYLKNGNLFHLKPCVWVFVTTPDSHDLSKGPDDDMPNKKEDFDSRIAVRCDISFEQLERDAKSESMDIFKFYKEERLEQVYLGANFLRRYFPEIIWTDITILQRFSTLPQKLFGPRRFRKLVASFENVKDGFVDVRHWPKKGEFCWNKIVKEVTDYDKIYIEKVVENPEESKRVSLIYEI